ncbi:hypothetical protein I317_04167 [Kwoniella heveanensis CBS 569]|nr:hypothetical protein I317_04167 [Kwoniella heveanensis CBS 569]
MFGTKKKHAGSAPLGPGGQKPSSSGLPTAPPGSGRSGGPINGQQLRQKQLQAQAKGMFTPTPNLHSQAQSLPAPAPAPAPTSTSIPISQRPLPPPALPQDQLNIPIPSGWKNAATVGHPDPSMYGYPPVWGMGYDGYQQKKPGLMTRLFGPKTVQWDDDPYAIYNQHYGLQGGKKLPKVKPVPSYGAPIPQLEPQAPTDPTIPPVSNARLPHRQEGLPTNWHELTKSQQKQILKDLEREEKQWKKVEKEQIRLYKASVKEREKEEKARAKLEKKIRKEKEKELLWRYKHPENPLPVPDPIDLDLIGMGVSPHTAAHVQAQTQGKGGSAQKPTPTTTTGPGGPGDPMKFMLLPTMEEFGIRRPFDQPGIPPALGGGGKTWPMMSRTMTHVSAFEDTT